MTLRELLTHYKVSPDEMLDSTIGASRTGIAISASMSGGYGDINELEITVLIHGLIAPDS